MAVPSSDDELDDVPMLSVEAIAALKEHFASSNHPQTSFTDELLKGNELVEDWQLSQFWYDDDTAISIVREALNQIPDKGTVALIGCPSLYYFFKKEAADGVQVKLLDIDRRFEVYNEDFCYYDYNRPLPPYIPDEWRNFFDIVIVDPPFLSEECLEKCCHTAKFMTKDKVIVCTGTVMEPHVEKLIDATRTSFRPGHRNNLGNEFACYINYESHRFAKIIPMDRRE